MSAFLISVQLLKVPRSSSHHFRTVKGTMTRAPIVVVTVNFDVGYSLAEAAACTLSSCTLLGLPMYSWVYESTKDETIVYCPQIEYSWVYGIYEARAM